jgi:hypothetical protein
MFMGKYCRIICRIDIIYFKYLRLNSPNILPHSVPGLWVHLVSALGPGAGVGVAAIRGAGVRAWLTRAGRYLSATGGRGGSLNSDRCGGGGCDPALGEIAGDKWAVRPIGSVRLDWRPGSWLGPWGRAVLRGGGWGMPQLRPAGGRHAAVWPGEDGLGGGCYRARGNAVDSGESAVPIAWQRRLNCRPGVLITARSRPPRFASYNASSAVRTRASGLRAGVGTRTQPPTLTERTAAALECVA